MKMVDSPLKTERPVFGKPVPTKFTESDTAFLQAAAQETGLPVSELVRRPVRLLRRQKETFRSYGFLLDIA